MIRIPIQLEFKKSSDYKIGLILDSGFGYGLPTLLQNIAFFVKDVKDIY